jgi:periplasmic protein TonB
VTQSRAFDRHDALGYTLLVAVALHALILLGTGFRSEPASPPPERLLEIMIVRPQAPSPTPPERPDALAQVSQEGSALEQSTEAPLTPSGPPLLEEIPAPPAEPDAPQTAPVEEVIAQPETATPAEAPVDAPARSRKPVSAASLLASTQLEIDRLTAEIDRRSRSSSTPDRRKSVNASTREYRYASYLEAWREKVERVGNLNYPDEARRRKLYGDLILHVSVRADGSLEKVRVVRSSGFPVLDDAAARIVKLASPFAPFPPEIAKDTDVLDITRTWQFTSSNRLFSSR